MAGIYWLALAAALLVAELATGTFFCVALAASAAAAAAAACFTQDFLWQVGCAAVLAILSCSFLALRKMRPRPAAQGNPDVGRLVRVDRWEGGRASVRYRGADWEAVLKEGCTPVPGTFVITGFDSNTLILEPQNKGGSPHA
ncbi:MAG: NfeD family protein [Mailhella sp.]|nr:NfeD family protein [Mailhella sp.]